MGNAALDQLIADTAASIRDPYLAHLFGNCFRNTLETTVDLFERDDRELTFVITGDIPAMWLRDSTAQVWPYLRLAQDPEIARLLRGVINQQAELIRRDPYANAFLKDAEAWGEATDLTDQGPGVWERKWEPDSLAYVMRLAHSYWLRTADESCFDDDWAAAMRLALGTLAEQQRFNGPGRYTFQRLTTNPIDTLANNGRGWPVKPNGMVAGAFRGSDDACVYPFNIPTQHLLVGALRGLAELATAIAQPELATAAANLANEIDAALADVRRQHVEWPYEIDGFGNALFVDDPNVPSLLSLPYLGACAGDDPHYLATRRRILSDANPVFYSGEVLAGIGSPHTGPNRVWPMALIMQTLTSLDEAEIERCLRMILASSGGRGLLNESVDVNDANQFSRAWFSWCNSLFAELILQLAAERPHLLQLDYGSALRR